MDRENNQVQKHDYKASDYLPHHSVPTLPIYTGTRDSLSSLYSLLMLSQMFLNQVFSPFMITHRHSLGIQFST